MQNKNIDISKWILLLTFSQVSGFTILQLNDVNEELVTSILDAVKDTRVHDDNYFPNINKGTVSKQLASKNIDSRKNLDVKDFMHKRLVKRIVPHGYEIKDFEYDNKFKTLFKPLVRLHKKKPDPEDSSDEEDRYDLIYIVDNKRLEDETNSNINISKDNSLLKPFTIDNMDIKYLPSDNEIEYIIDRDGKKLDYDPRSNNKFNKLGQSRYELADNKNQIKAKKIKNNDLSPYTDDDKLKQVFGTQNEHWVQYDQESPKSKYIRELLDKIAKINKNKQLREPKTKPEKRHRFVSIGKFSSNQFKPEQNIHELEEIVARSYKLKSLPSIYANNKNYIKILDVLQQNVQKQTKSKENKKEIKPLGWFGPVKVINSKQLIKTDENNNIINPKIYELRHYQPIDDNDWLGPLKKMIQEHQKVASDEDRLIDSKSKEENIRELFRSIGHINPKHKHDNWKRETDTEREPFYFTMPKGSRERDEKSIDTLETKSNKFKLLNEIAQLSSKSSNLDEGKERLKELEADKTKELRSHIKSGEEEEEANKQRQKFDYDDGHTTEKYVTYKPKYPFWNEWTYDKQIPQEDCKGNLVQLGRLCVNAWA